MQYEWIPIDKCPVCGSSEKEQYGVSFAQKYEHGTGIALKVDQCVKCKSVYQNPRLTDASLEEFYRSGTYERDHPRQVNKEISRADRLLLLIERFKIDPKSCLDVGCGTGQLLKHLEAYFFARILGLEYSEIEYVIDEVVHSREEVTGTYDLITCIHVLEHVTQPLELLKWMVSKLNPNGTLIVEVPMEKKIDLPHVQIFSMEGLEYMMKEIGMNYLFLNMEQVGIMLIGEKYKGYQATRVFYSYDSPDFATQEEYMDWFSKWYMVEKDKQK